MLRHLAEAWEDPAAPPALNRYLLHYARIVCAVSSSLLARVGTAEACAQRDQFWEELRRDNPWLQRRLRRSLIARL